jgi:hypothetical protein
MTKTGINEVPLPSDRAFVLQFKPAAENGGCSYAGRVEHIASGQVEIFYSTEELCAKLKVILNRQKSGAGE